jgi:zinc transporter
MNPPEGLIHAMLLDGHGGARKLAWEEVSSWSPEAGCLWTHFDFTKAGVEEWLIAGAGLNTVAVQALMSVESRPRVLNRGDNLQLSLRGVNLNPGSDPEDMVSLRIWTDGKRVISSRRRRLLSTDDLLEMLEAGSGPCTAAELLAAWTDNIISRMGNTVDEYEDQVLALEDRVISDEISGVRYELAQLRKQTISIRRYLAPQREALNRLTSEQFSWMDDMSRLRLRDTSDRQIRHLEDIDEVRERAAMAQEELLSRVSEQMNSRMYVLSIVAAIFLPLGFFTGLMGINVGGMPGVESGFAFWIVVSICVGVMAALGLVFRLKKWF